MTRRGQGRREPAGHIDDWLMTYADMITLLLCFFVIFAIVSNSRKELQHNVPRLQIPAVTAQIPPPIPAPRPRPEAPRPSAQPAPRQAAAPQAPVQPQPRRSAALRSSVASSSVSPPPPPARDVEKAEPRSAGAATKAAPRTDAPPPAVKAPDAAAASPAKTEDAAVQPLTVIPPPELAGSPKQHVVAAAPKGDRITTFEMGSAAFFDSGSAALSDSGKTILRSILPRLTAALVEGYRIKVEGHTDDTPIHTAQFPSNWELSTARASAVVHFFLAQGIPAQRLRAVGYADTDPKAPNRDAAGNPIPQNQAENRRVVIRLEKIQTAER